jgi:hypothetical protein
VVNGNYSACGKVKVELESTSQINFGFLIDGNIFKTDIQ